MADEGKVYLPDSERTSVLTAPIGDYLVKKMIQAYEGGFDLSCSQADKNKPY